MLIIQAKEFKLESETFCRACCKQIKTDLSYLYCFKCSVIYCENCRRKFETG
jgi:hypothetical protein